MHFARTTLAAIIAVACSCHPHASSSPWKLVPVPPNDTRADWLTLPVVSKIGDVQDLARHERFMTDPDLDERASLGPFDLRWRSTGYHSMPSQWEDPYVCEPSDCEGTKMPVWRGSGGIYRRVAAIRHDVASDVWYVSTTEAMADERLGVAFKRVRR